jgi:integrase/recombinase XerD
MATNRSQVPILGPLAPYASGFRCRLAEEGYAPVTASRLIRLMDQLSRWLEAHDLAARALTVPVVQEFLGARYGGAHGGPTARTFTVLLAYLGDVGVVLPAVSSSPRAPVSQLLEEFGTYLSRERGLAAGTVVNYQRAAGLFLCWLPAVEGRLDLMSLTAAEVSAFVLSEVPCRRRGSARNLVTGIRSLLRFLYLEERIPTPLAQGLPTAAGWSGSALPRALHEGQVARLLASCDRRRGSGRRDYAVMMLLVRLGLRAGEVAALQLGDIDWRAGEVVIHGKGRHEERLPLPVDVGEAVAGYLRRGRPVSPCRAVFLRAHAPRNGLTSGAVGDLVRAAGQRAGVAGAGAHRLRHTAATGMLRAGASLTEVALVLRHANTATTAGYAKVDHDALRALALPWPGGAR